MSSDKKNESEPQVELLDHNYDGIQELDNMLPRWWLALFYITIVFAVVYYVHYELGNGQSIAQEFQADVDLLQEKTNAKNQTPFPDVEKLAAMQKEPESLKKGQAVYQARCASCHGDRGQGLIGPNFTDSYWLHGDGKPASIGKIIYVGVPEKGMPPWGPVLTEDEVYGVTVYVSSLKGTNASGGKAPQGTLVKE